jgi:hypothetical protein
MIQKESNNSYGKLETGCTKIYAYRIFIYERNTSAEGPLLSFVETRTLQMLLGVTRRMSYGNERKLLSAPFYQYY